MNFKTTADQTQRRAKVIINHQGGYYCQTGWVGNVCRARDGDPKAMAQLGDMYRENTRQEQDHDRAAHFAQKAEAWLRAASSEGPMPS